MSDMVQVAVISAVVTLINGPLLLNMIAKQQEKQVEVYKTFIEQTQQVQEAVHEIAEEQKIEEEKIEQAETVDDVIVAANDIVFRFNAGGM